MLFATCIAPASLVPAQDWKLIHPAGSSVTAHCSTKLDADSGEPFFSSAWSQATYNNVTLPDDLEESDEPWYNVWETENGKFGYTFIVEKPSDQTISVRVEGVS